MSVQYQVQALQCGRPDWRSALERAMAVEVEGIGLHTTIEVQVTDAAPSSMNTPCVAVVLVGPGSKSDPSLLSAIDQALGCGLVVVPVVDDLATFPDQAPAPLSPYNAFEWSGHSPELRLARVLLEELGIEDRDRRVFLSHKREDGLGAAEQLHDELTRHRFDPFIDRFAIPPGVKVQALIADTLEQYAFLLILETPLAHLSTWVYDEVDYALSHTMGMLIVRWPGNPKPIPGTVGIPRLELTDTELTTDAHGYDILIPEALDGLVRRVEAEHASGLVRRRRMLVRSIEEAARNAGGTSIPLKDWALDVTTATGRSIVAIAPRLPSALDLQRLDEVREKIAPTAEALLVHSTRLLGDQRTRHLAWVTGSRNLAMLPDNAIGAKW